MLSGYSDATSTYPDGSNQMMLSVDLMRACQFATVRASLVGDFHLDANLLLLDRGLLSPWTAWTEETGALYEMVRQPWLAKGCKLQDSLCVVIRNMSDIISA